MNKILKELLKNKRTLALVLIFAVGLIFVFAFSSGGESAEAGNEDGSQSLSEYKAELEAELSELCSSVKGVGKCTVTVSFSRGAENTYKGSSLVETKPPEVLGVIVVCKGADSDAVRAELTRLFTALFDLPSNRVAILKLN